MRTFLRICYFLLKSHWTLLSDCEYVRIFISLRHCSLFHHRHRLYEYFLYYIKSKPLVFGKDIKVMCMKFIKLTLCVWGIRRRDKRLCYERNFLMTYCIAKRNRNTHKKIESSALGSVTRVFATLTFWS